MCTSHQIIVQLLLLLFITFVFITLFFIHFTSIPFKSFQFPCLYRRYWYLPSLQSHISDNSLFAHLHTHDSRISNIVERLLVNNLSVLFLHYSWTIHQIRIKNIEIVWKCHIFWRQTKIDNIFFLYFQAGMFLQTVK